MLSRVLICHAVLLCGLTLDAVAQERIFTAPIPTSYGLVIGEVSEDYCSFKGIPYAAPPVGDLRWQPPSPPQKWEKPLMATAFGPACVQMLEKSDKLNPDTATAFYGKVGSLSEDCLYLNIWSPVKAPSEGCPVFVFFHGGRLLEGSGAQECFDGQNFARKGVVVVTVNYRLNILGFLAHPALTATSPAHTSGNYGLQDALAALRWVKQNITAFGGDPAKVTIGGEAIAIAMMAVPDAAGLFHRAIIDSASMPPSLRKLGLWHHDLESMESVGVEAMKKLGITETGIAALPAMRGVSWQNLLGTIVTSLLYGSGVENDLCIDGVILKKDSSRLFSEGQQNAVPMIIGTDQYEGTMFEHPLAADNLGAFRTVFREILGGHAVRCEELYPFNTVEEARKQFTRMETDLVMANARFYASCNSALQPDTYLYQFRREPKWAADSWRKAFHGIDQAYAFGTLVPREQYDEVDRKVSDTMMDYWIQFMKTGDPNGPGLERWPRYTAKDDETFLLDVTVSVAKGLRALELDTWTEWMKKENK